MRDKKAPKIAHTPIGKAGAGEPIEIRAVITDQSAVFGATVYYRLASGTEFLSASLVKTSGDEYVATIPAAAVTSDVDYFLEAFDVHGNGPTLVGSQPKPLRIAVVAVTKPPDGGNGNNQSTTTRPDAGTAGPGNPDSGPGPTKLPDTKPGGGQVKDGEGDSTGLVIAIVASVTAAIVVAAAVTGVLIYYFTQPTESPGTVTLKITAPPPVQSPLGSTP